MASLNLDRGCLIRFTPEGIAVAMYYDQPGVWYNEHGSEVTSVLAKSAGYDTVILLKERTKRERMAQAAQAVAAQFEGEEPATEEVVKEKNGFKLVHIGLDRHNIVDPDGNILNKNHLTRAEGVKVLAALVPDEAGAPETSPEV